MNFEFDYNAGIIIKKIFDDVLNYFHNRSTWKNLYRARDDIINLNSNMKIENPLRESSAFKSHEIIANDTHEWTVNFYSLYLVFSKNFDKRRKNFRR
jgi:hypothetical protein